MKKEICLILAAGLLMLSACSSEAEKPLDGSENTTLDDTTEMVPEYTLPERSNHNGEEFLIFAADGREELYDAELNGDVLNDAVYNRRINVEDHLGIKLAYTYQPSGWAVKDQYTAALNSAIMANEPYSLVTGPVVFLPQLLTDGYFKNINDLNIDLDNPWWVSGIRDTAEVEGQIYLLAGDFANTFYSTINVFYFNMKILNDFNLTEPYEYVRDGSWTIDKMLSMTKDVSADLDNDGQFTLENDRFVMLTHSNPARSFQSSSGIEIFKKNGHTIEYVGMSDKIDVLISKMRSMFEVGEASSVGGEYEELTKIFADDRTLFMTVPIRMTSALRDMKSDYGILPYPKLEESQNYQSHVSQSTVLWAIPVTAPDYELTADFCEYYSYLSLQNVAPAYYEKTLKDKFSRDENTREMLDIIRSSVTMTFDLYYGQYFSPNPFDITGALLTSGNEPASYIAGLDSSWKTQLETLLEGFSALKSKN